MAQKFPKFQFIQCRTQHNLQTRGAKAISILELNENSCMYSTKKFLNHSKIIYYLIHEYQYIDCLEFSWISQRYSRYLRSIVPLIGEDRVLHRKFPALEKFSMNVNNLNDWCILRRKSRLSDLIINTNKVNNTLLDYDDDFMEASLDQIKSLALRLSKNKYMLCSLKKFTLDGVLEQRMRIIMRALSKLHELGNFKVSVSIHINKDGDFEGTEEDPQILQFFTQITSLSIQASGKLLFFGYLVQNPKLFPSLRRFNVEIYGKIHENNPWPIRYVKNLEQVTDFRTYSHNLSVETTANYCMFIRIPPFTRTLCMFDSVTEKKLEDYDYDISEQELEYFNFLSQFDTIKTLRVFKVQFAVKESDLQSTALAFLPMVERLPNLEEFEMIADQFKPNKEMILEEYEKQNMVFDLFSFLEAGRIFTHTLRILTLNAAILNIYGNQFMELLPKTNQLRSLELGDFWTGIKNLQPFLQFLDQMGEMQPQRKPIKLTIHHIYFVNTKALDEALSQLYQPRHVEGSMVFDVQDLDPVEVLENCIAKFAERHKGKKIMFQLKMMLKEDNLQVQRAIFALSMKGVFKIFNSLEIEAQGTTYSVSQ